MTRHVLGALCCGASVLTTMVAVVGQGTPHASGPNASQAQAGVYQPTHAGVAASAPIHVRTTAEREAKIPFPRLHERVGPVDKGWKGKPELEKRAPVDLQVIQRHLAPSLPVPASTGASAGPVKTFLGEILTGGSIPPDTMGAVGTNHVVTVTNNEMNIRTRDGALITRLALNAFWAGVALEGGITTPSTFDPKIYYDRFNGRYFFFSSANAVSPASSVLFAVTQTNDPTGVWDRYVFDADAAATSVSGRWADFPTVGQDSRWIVANYNVFNYGASGTTGYYGPYLYVIPKADAYDGGTLTTTTLFQESFANCTAPFEQKLACGFTMAPSTDEDNTSTTNYLVEDWDSAFAQLRLSKITGPANAPVLTVGTQFPQSTENWRFNAARIGSSGGYVPQRDQVNFVASAASRLMANDSRINNTVLRNGSVWASHHVMIGAVSTPPGTPFGGANPDVKTAVQWWQIDPGIEAQLDLVSGLGTPPIQRGRIVDPDADNCHNGASGERTPCTQQGQFFFFAGIAVNKDDDVLIGFSQSSALIFASGAYAMRRASDPPNTMRDPVVFRSGVANYNIGAGSGSARQNRWGDYSAAQVDPLNDTDFWTVQQYGPMRQELPVLGAGVIAAPWATWWALVSPTATQPTSTGNLIISEFRFRGPAGINDEFIELFNPSTTVPFRVSSGDNSDGWAVATNNGTTTTPLTVVPHGVVIPPLGHYLIANSPVDAAINPPNLTYSLDTYPGASLLPGLTTNGIRTATADTGYSTGASSTDAIADNAGIALFKSADAASGFTTGNQSDAAGFAGAGTTFREGIGIPPISAGAVTGQISFLRDEISGTPQDTNDNATDFLFVNPLAPSETLGSTPFIGAPGPENVDGPLQVTTPADLANAVLDPDKGDNESPNFVFDPTPDPANESTFGTVTIRRTFTNNSGAPIPRLRFRIIDLTTHPAPAGTADLRVRTSGASTVTISGANAACTGSSCAVEGVTLEDPPAQSLSGGINSTLAAGTVTFAAPLADGSTLNLNFLLGIEQQGNFRFAVLAEALPGVSSSFDVTGCAAASCPDVEGPSVTINQAAGQPDPTNTSPINFTVVFNESVTDFATGDVTLSGTAGATTATVTGSGTTYNVAVSGMTQAGTVIASIGAGVATDPAGNSNTASTSSDNTVTFDNVAPTVTINQAAGQPDPANASPIHFTVIFSEPVVNFATGDVTIGGSAGATTATVSGSGTTYNVAVSGMTQPGTVTATVAAGVANDAAANPNTASTSSDDTVTFDNVQPTVTIDQAAGQADPSNTSPINFTVVFSEPVADFATGDVTLGGTAGATTATVTGSAATYNVAVSGMTQPGTVTATVAAGVASDAAANQNTASTSTDNTVTSDNVQPTVTINRAAGQDDPANASPINFTVVFSEPITDFATGDVTLDGTAGATTATVTGSGTTYNVAVSGMTQPGTVTATVAAGVANDAAANPNTASTSMDNTVNFDNVQPTVTIDQAAGQADPTDAWPINFSVVFSEAVTGFTSGDVTLSGTAGATTATVTGSGANYNVAVGGMSSEGTVVVSIAGGVAADAATNTNALSTSSDDTVTFTPPPAQPLNIATRVRVEPGEKLMIGGFIITGSAPKDVVIRGLGPALAPGVQDFLQDPMLEMRGSDGSLIAQNDNWKDSQRDRIEGGPFQPNDDRESVIVITLQPGAYTALLTGKGATSGVGLVEVYDTNSEADSRLSNLSTRGFVQTGENVMIAGFILAGGNSGHPDIAVRGIGPSLVSKGVSDALVDPLLRLNDANGNEINVNNNYADDTSSAAQLAAKGLTPEHPNEAAIFMSLLPGAYTAVLEGFGADQTGVGLVEVYDLE